MAALCFYPRYMCNPDQNYSDFPFRFLSRVLYIYFIQGAAIEYFQKGLVVISNNQILTAQRKVSNFAKSVTTASGSPSIGSYRDSVTCIYLLATLNNSPTWFCRRKALYHDMNNASGTTRILSLTSTSAWLCMTACSCQDDHTFIPSYLLLGLFDSANKSFRLSFQ